MSNRDYQIVKKILSEIEIIEKLTEGFDLGKFISDERTKRAVCMTLINIGELTKSLTDGFKLSYDSVSWRGIAGMRDITAHKYQTLKMGDVWNTLANDIPNLKRQLNDILKNV
ncbi:MAG: antitoxin [Clostridia bacterium BRH_c25]|nr:MAG: antitoxin [Clostridia bacterium BRH_c25]